MNMSPKKEADINKKAIIFGNTGEANSELLPFYKKVKKLFAVKRKRLVCAIRRNISVDIVLVFVYNVVKVYLRAKY